MRMCLVVAAFLLLAVSVSPGAAEDRHEGYYYPTVGSSEVYEARVPAAPDSDRRRRLGFISGITKQLAERPYPPGYAMFAKGGEAEKLIVIGYGGGPFDTVYRARAMFATLSSLLRLGPLFQGTPIDDQATFFDLAKLLGFEQITVSDGATYAHRIELK
jgi:hypothetical protein